MTTFGETTQTQSAKISIKKVGRFLWHLLQMVIAMELGMMIYHLVQGTVLSGTAFTALTHQNRLFGYWMMVIPMVLGMAVLMYFQKTTWRYSLEMSLSMLAPLGILTVLVLCSLAPVHLLFVIGDPLMIVAMAGYMLLRPHQHKHAESQPACHTA